MEIFSGPYRKYEYIDKQTDGCTDDNKQNPVIRSAQEISRVVPGNKNDTECQLEHPECIFIRLHGLVDFQITSTET